jgi:hypothetical protein
MGKKGFSNSFLCSKGGYQILSLPITVHTHKREITIEGETKTPSRYREKVEGMGGSSMQQGSRTCKEKDQYTK